MANTKKVSLVAMSILALLFSQRFASAFRRSTRSRLYQKRTWAQNEHTPIVKTGHGINSTALARREAPNSGMTVKGFFEAAVDPDGNSSPVRDGQGALLNISSNITNVHEVATTTSEAPESTSSILKSDTRQYTAFLVRTYNPSAESVQRIVRWVLELSTMQNVHTYIQIDVTQKKHEASVASLLDSLKAVGFDVGANVNSFTIDDLLTAYPDLAKVDAEGQWIPKAFQAQPILLWWETLPNPKQYKHVWVSEDDVGYSGVMSHLISKYSENLADLIGGRAPDWAYRRHVSFWPDAMTPKFREWVPFERRIVVTEHILRVSSELLNEVSSWSKDGAIDISERTWPSVCRFTSMNCIPFLREDLGRIYRPAKPSEPHRWNMDTIDDKSGWMQICSEDEAARHPRLYHPLKF